MRFDVLTIFPKMFESPLAEGLVGQAVKAGQVQFKTWDLRAVTSDVHKTVDDKPFGGSDGMVFLPEVLRSTLENVLKEKNSAKKRVIYLSPQGALLTQKKAQQLAKDFDQLILISGRYAGLDERFIDKYVDEEISIGDYIVTGGELPALIIMDAVTRFIPGTLGNEKSPVEESFKNGLLEEALYTRPRVFENMSVPEVLTSGHHAKIEAWKKTQRLARTFEKRPDLLKGADLDKPEMLDAFASLGLTKRVAVGLVHYPVYNKEGNVVATNVTNLDIHDIARACRTFGVENFYVITPMGEQLAFVGRVLEHWQSGRGMQYNPVRQDALKNTKAAYSIESALEDWTAGGELKDVKLVTTSARQVVGPKSIHADDLRILALKNPLFLLFGTGYGLENAVVRKSDYLLEPIRGRAADGFRHLSVRSAVSIILDRLFGPCY